VSESLSELLAAARDWLADCSWRDLEAEEIADLPDAAVVGGVARHYEGGWEQFVRDSGLEPEAVTLEMHPRGRLSPLAV
jgi:hypothetical protein